MATHVVVGCEGAAICCLAAGTDYCAGSADVAVASTAMSC